MAFINTYKDLVINPGADFEFRLNNTGSGAAAGALGTDASFEITWFNEFRKTSLLKAGAVVAPKAPAKSSIKVTYDNTEDAINVSGTAEAGRAFTAVFEITALNVEAVYGRDSRDWGRNIIYSFKYDTNTAAQTFLEDLYTYVNEEANSNEGQFSNPYIKINATKVGDLYTFEASQNTFTFALRILDEYGKVLPSLSIEEHRQTKVRSIVNTAGTSNLSILANEIVVDQNGVIYKNTSGAPTTTLGGLGATVVGQVGHEGVNTPQLLDASIRLRTESSVYPYAIREHELSQTSAIPGYKSFTILGKHETEGLSHNTTHVIYVHPSCLSKSVVVTGTKLTATDVNTATSAEFPDVVTADPVSGTEASLDAVLTAFAANL